MIQPIFSDIKKVISSSLMSKLIEVIKNYVVLRVLEPVEYGVLALFNQVRNLSKYGDFGYLNVLERDYNAKIAEGHASEAEQIRNISISLDLILLCCLVLMALLSGWLFFEISPWIVLAAGMSILAYRLFRIFQTDNRVKLKFADYAKYQLLLSIGSASIVLATIHHFGIWSPTLINALLVFGFIITLLLIKPFTYQFQINKSEFIRQTKIGIHISVITMSFGACLYVERFLVLKQVGYEGLGYFAFCLFFVNLATQLSSDVNRPLVPRVRQALAVEDWKSMRHMVGTTLKWVYPLSVIGVVVLTCIPNEFMSTLFPKYDSAFLALKIIVWTNVVNLPSVFYGYLMYSKGVGLEYHTSFIHLLYAVLFIVCALSMLETNTKDYIQQLSFIYLGLNSVRTFLQMGVLKCKLKCVLSNWMLVLCFLQMVLIAVVQHIYFMS